MLVEQRQAEKPEVRECAEWHDKDMSLGELMQLAVEMLVPMLEKPTRGLPMRLIRGTPGQTVFPFGKLKAWMYHEVPTGYLHWEAAANKNSSDDLVRLTNRGRRSWTAARRLEPMSRT